MESIEFSEQNVALELNGVAVDVDVIVKDAEIELNNNEMVKVEHKLVNSRENLTEETELAAEEITDDDEKSAEPSESSTNTDNGPEKSVDNSFSEGDSKVDEASETAGVKCETSDSSESSETATSTNSADEIEHSEDVDKDLEKVDDSSEQSNDGEKQTEESTVAPAENDTPNDTEQAADAIETNEEPKTDSPNKSPKKKSPNKKRKNRSRSRKQAVDYTKFVNYALSVSQRQRRYFLQVARGRHNVPVPGDDCEIFVSNIPINVLEPELLPLFERFGKIFELRLMMSTRNPKRNAGFAFVRFTTNDAAQQATESLNDYEIVPGKHLAIRLSQPNLSLFVGNIHRGLTREQIHEKIGSKTTGLVKTFVKSSLYEDTKNCGFCFLEYDSHSAALEAKRLLNRGNVWGRQLFVDWAQRRKQLDESALQESKTIFINYLPKEITDQQITDVLSPFGTIEKVTKIKDYAFVLFTEHQAAINALNDADKTKFGSDTVEISLAMPKSMKTRSRAPSFAFRRPRQSQRSNSYNRHMPAFNSSNKFYMRKPLEAENDQNTTTSETVEQTIIPTMVVTPPEPLPVN